MNYLYHMVPENMTGETLYPLNSLKSIFPALYEKQAAKYAGREYLMSMKVPLLNCLWNDVLHCTAVNPAEIKQALKEAGDMRGFTRNFFKIDPSLLSVKDTVIYLYSIDEAGNKFNAKNFIPYHPEDMGNYSKLPSQTKEYYVEEIKKGKKPLLFHLVPHILFRGPLDTRAIPIVQI
jgi:hypothetical protein